MNAIRLSALLFVLALRIEGQPARKLVEELRIGGEADGPASFNAISSYGVDAKGRILVMDNQTKDIRMFDATGKWLRTIGRAGRGPGEMAKPQGFLLSSTGEIWVRDAGEWRLTVFSGEGEYRRQHRLAARAYGWGWPGRFTTDGRLQDATWITRGNGQRFGVLRYSADAAQVDTLFPPPLPEAVAPGEGVYHVRYDRGERYVQVPYAPRSIQILAPDGDFWTVPSTREYRLVKRRIADGTSARELRRDLKPVAVTSAERDIEEARLTRMFGAEAMKAVDLGLIPRVKPIIKDVAVSDDGRVWVSRTIEGGKLELDEWSAAGRLVASYPAPASLTLITGFVARGDRAWAIVTDEDDVPVVLRWRLVR